VTAAASASNQPEVFYGRVDGDATVAYGLATNDRNDLYFQGLAVPPLFTVSLVLDSHRQSARTTLPLMRGATRRVHGEHDLRMLGSVRPNMALQWETSLYGIRNTRGGVIDTHRTLVSDSQGRPLVEHLWSNFSVGVTIEEEVGPEKPPHTFPESARHRPAGTRAVPVDRDQTFRYAGVSGDHVGHALDDEIARSEGYPGKILQGLCALGVSSGAVVDIAAGGDPRRIRRLACRFSRPAFPQRDLVVDVYEAGDAKDSGRAFAFEVSQGGITVIKHGRAEVGPPL
jgi:acyl dehydratase